MPAINPISSVNKYLSPNFFCISIPSSGGQAGNAKGSKNNQKFLRIAKKEELHNNAITCTLSYFLLLFQPAHDK